GGLALVVALLALGQRDLELDLVALPVHRGGHEGVAVALHAADQVVDLAPVQQQLAAALGVGDDMGRGLDQRRDLRAVQEQLAIAHHRVAFADVRAAGANRLELPALQRHSRLEALVELVIVARAPVQRDGPVAVCLILAALLAHSAIVPEAGHPREPCPRSNAAPWWNIQSIACSSWSTTSPPTRAASAGATTRGSSKLASRGCWRGWNWASAASGPGSPPRTPCRLRTTSRWSCATARSGACMGAGSSMRWTRTPARSRCRSTSSRRAA